MWSIKKEDMSMKERLSKMKLLESLIAKPEVLHEYEEALKKKLISDFVLSSEATVTDLLSSAIRVEKLFLL
ncbi:hypothetical protein DY000_02038911 [Brassica cretica]|uniref:Uncharacterized protein n=1 Tax=Brassica cretica TaxID=69181 RepID=A0ABQ7BNB0_BRACR|nr:hypothetical protein DY000_02038911 [Brassica cretica]